MSRINTLILDTAVFAGTKELIGRLLHSHFNSLHHMNMEDALIFSVVDGIYVFSEGKYNWLNESHIPYFTKEFFPGISAEKFTFQMIGVSLAHLIMEDGRVLDNLVALGASNMVRSAVAGGMHLGF